MPVYEFYCSSCNTIFSFFSRSVNTSALPDCPKCSRPLKRQMSVFACIDSGRTDSGTEELPLDEGKLEGAISQLAAEADRLDAGDPKQAARLMRKFSDMTGVKLGGGMQEALDRLEAGENPDDIEADMGDILESEDPFQPGQKAGRTTKAPPRRDETLYDL